MKETYVFEGVEVTRTGRTAEREIRSVRGASIRKLTLVEITPIDDTVEWKKWVDPAHLFIIQNYNK